ncbi:UNVERIFIED_CONTAM: hypothetical protein NCL1_37132 [Trichonephila clavipes]
MYHPPHFKSLSTDLQDLFTVGTICLGDLNAKHPIWDCLTANLRGNELLDIIDGKCFSILNDGMAAHFSYTLKADWKSIAEAVDNGIKSIPLTDSVDLNWCSLKEMILRAAKKYIQRGKLKNRKLYLSSISPLLQPLLEERKRRFENRDTGRNNHSKTEKSKLRPVVLSMAAAVIPIEEPPFLVGISE